MTRSEPGNESRSKNRRRSAREFERSEPVFSSTPSRSSGATPSDEPRFEVAGKTEPVWQDDPPASFERRQQRHRPSALWIAAPLFVAAAALVTYLYLPPMLPRPMTATDTPTPPSQTAEIPPPAPTGSLPMEQDPEAAAAAQTPAVPAPAPAQTADLPTTPPTSSQPAGKDVAALPFANPVVAPPTPDAVPQTTPTAQPEAPPAFSPPQPALQPPDTAAAAAPSSTPSTAITHGSTASREHPVREARAKPPRSLIPDGDSAPQLRSPGPQAEDDTVTIDGTTYVKGREPQALGSLSATNSPTEPTPETEPSPGPGN
jgi:hypothetical protein